MHRVLLYHTGNVQFLVLYTGMATGICVVSFWPHGRDAHGLRSHRLNLISAHTCVGKPPAFFTLFLPSPLPHEGGPTQNY